VTPMTRKTTTTDATNKSYSTRQHQHAKWKKPRPPRAAAQSQLHKRQRIDAVVDDGVGGSGGLAASAAAAAAAEVKPSDDHKGNDTDDSLPDLHLSRHGLKPPPQPKSSSSSHSLLAGAAAALAILEKPQDGNPDDGSMLSGVPQKIDDPIAVLSKPTSPSPSHPADRVFVDEDGVMTFEPGDMDPESPGKFQQKKKMELVETVYFCHRNVLSFSIKKIYNTGSRSRF
jgi:hypothetical protein